MNGEMCSECKQFPQNNSQSMNLFLLVTPNKLGMKPDKYSREDGWQVTPMSSNNPHNKNFKTQLNLLILEWLRLIYHQQSK